MPMPNDKNQDMSPQDNRDEERYSFLQETIKPKPISREQLVKQFVRVAIYGVILGVFACIGFFALKPWAQNWFYGEKKTVTIPEDEAPGENDQDISVEDEAAAPVMNAESYATIMGSMNEIAAEARKGLVLVEPLSSEKDWNAEITGIRAGSTGIITADNGQELLILTESSVCASAGEWNVRFQDGKSYRAALKKKDENHGLAVFIVPRAGIEDSTWDMIRVSVLGNSNLVAQGDTVIALGNLFGYEDGTGYGQVSSTAYKTAFYDGECTVIATDIPIEKEGNGVLFNMEGEVIGLISASVWGENGNSVVNAYAVSNLKVPIEFLLNGQGVPYVGIYGTTVTSELETENQLPAGIYVVDVDPDSPAMTAGIQSGDIICQVEDKEVTGIGEFQRAVFDEKTESEITVRGKRLGADGYVDIDFKVVVGTKE